MPTKPSDNQRKKPAGVRAWGGFGDDILDWSTDYGRDYLSPRPCVYKTRKEASKYYEDVRPVLITEVKSPARKKRGRG